LVIEELFSSSVFMHGHNPRVPAPVQDGGDPRGCFFSLIGKTPRRGNNGFILRQIVAEYWAIPNQTALTGKIFGNIFLSVEGAR
jgi:hypothetical protein